MGSPNPINKQTGRNQTTRVLRHKTYVYSFQINVRIDSYNKILRHKPNDEVDEQSTYAITFMNIVGQRRTYQLLNLV
jgi:hypothetical protein